MEFKGIINIQNSGSITEGHDLIMLVMKFIFLLLQHFRLLYGTFFRGYRNYGEI